METTTRHWWFSTRHMTFYVGTDASNIITKTAPIGRKFVGQHIKNLANWLRKQGGFKYAELGK